MKFTVSTPELIGMIHEELSVIAEQDEAPAPSKKPRYQELFNDPDYYWDNVEGKVVSIPPELVGDPTLELDPGDSSQLPLPIDPEGKSPAGFLVDPSEIESVPYGPPPPPPLEGPPALTGPTAIGAGELIRRNAARLAGIGADAPDAVLAAKEALEQYKGPKFTGSGSPRGANPPKITPEYDDLMRALDVAEEDWKYKPGQRTKPTRTGKLPLKDYPSRDWGSRGRTGVERIPGVGEKMNPGLESKIADLETDSLRQQKIISSMDEIEDAGGELSRKQRRQSAKAAKNIARNQTEQSALRTAHKNPAFRQLIRRLAQTGAVAAAGTAIELAGAGLTAAEITDFVLGSGETFGIKHGLDVLPTWKGGENISWTDAFDRENLRGLDPSSVRARDTGGSQGPNPLKGYNVHLDTGTQAGGKPSGVDVFGRSRDPIRIQTNPRERGARQRINEGTNNMNKLEQIIEQLVTEEIDKYVSETKELTRWSELAGLKETSAMAGGAVGGASGPVSSVRRRHREDDEDALQEHDLPNARDHRHAEEPSFFETGGKWDQFVGRWSPGTTDPTDNRVLQQAEIYKERERRRRERDARIAAIAAEAGAAPFDPRAEAVEQLATIDELSPEERQNFLDSMGPQEPSPEDPLPDTGLHGTELSPEEWQSLLDSMGPQEPSPEDPLPDGLEEAKKKKDWIQKAVNPDHKGYCTPMTKSTCTPKRKALAKRFKKAGKKEKKKGGTGWEGKV